MAERVNAPGVDYNAETGRLTIRTDSADWNDLTLALIHGAEQITGIMATVATHGGRVEDGFRGLTEIVIRRPGGQAVRIEGGPADG